jgi:hypothetical protein
VTTPDPAGPKTHVVPYRWRDGRGTWRDAEGVLYLPAGKPDGTRHPIVFHAGYEIPEPGAAGFLAAGVGILSTRTPEDGAAWPGGSPVSRGPEMDLALLRAARAHPAVDDSRIAVTGGSGGGYAALMVTAGTFPLNGSFPVAPPFDLRYTFGCWLHDCETIAAPRPDGEAAMRHPGCVDMQAMAREVIELHGSMDGARMLAYSPISHVDRITCPVVTWLSTADSLAPFPQIGGPLAARAIADSPAMYPIDPAIISKDLGVEVASPALLEALPEDELQVVVLEVPEGTPLFLDATSPPPGAIWLPAPGRTHRWLVMIIDEGGTGEDVGHFRHAVSVDTGPLLVACLTSPVTLEQLTPAKLLQLCDRVAGRGWILPGDDDHASDPEVLDAERADVARGLRTYAAASGEHRARLDALLDELDPARREELTPYVPL